MAPTMSLSTLLTSLAFILFVFDVPTKVAAKNFLDRHLKPCPEDALVTIDTYTPWLTDFDRIVAVKLVAANTRYCEYNAIIYRTNDYNFVMRLTAYARRGGSRLTLGEAAQLQTIEQRGRIGRDDKHKWLFFPSQEGRYKPLNETKLWERLVNDGVVMASSPNENTIKTCTNFMENRVYGLVVKVFPELALRRDLLLRRKLDEKFAMKDIDFKSVKFRDNLEFMAITEDQDVIEGWRVDSGQMKSADARFNPAWTEPRLKKYSEFPLEDYGSTEGVCKSRLREKRLKEMGQTLA